MRLGRDSLRRRVSVVPPRAVLALGWLVFLIYAYPGQLTQDSLDQLAEGRAGVYTDGHPPVMAALWGLVDRFTVGALGMLVIQSVVLLIAMHRLLRRVTDARQAAWWAIAILLFPPVMTPMAVIWKDSLMAAFLLLGLSLVLDPRRGVRLWGLAALGLGAAMRYNGPAATLPLVVLLFEWRPGLARLARYATAAAAWLAITLGGMAVNAALVDQPTHSWHASLAVMDVAGTVCFSDHAFSDDELRDTLAGTELRIDHDIEATMCRLYGARNYIRLTRQPEGLWDLTVDGARASSAPQRDAIERAWRHLVLAHPGGYLVHRAYVFANVVGLLAKPYGMVTAKTPRFAQQFSDVGLPTRASRLQLVWADALGWLASSTPLFAPYLYLALALVLGWRGRRDREALATLLSGIALMGSLFLLAGSPDYRYSHWLVVVTMLVVVRAVARRATARQRSTYPA